jgi:hypothetical protein
MEFVKIVTVICALVGTLIAAYRFFWKAPSEKEVETATSKNETIATRFFALFESHGVHRNQIPDFFDHGLTLHDCADEAELLKKLDTQTLMDASELFGVNLEWLQGSSSEIYDIPSFYKDNKACEKYLTEFKSNRPDAQITTYVLTANADKQYLDEENAVLFIAEVIGHINDREIYRYHLAGKIQKNYWKARAYFAVSCALLIKHGFHPIGQTVDEEWLITLNKGKTLIEYNYHDGWQDFILPSRCVWYVDEFLEYPDKYLAGVDLEMNNFGHISALQMWLEFKHFMKIDDESSYKKAQTAFENKLEELS